MRTLAELLEAVANGESLTAEDRSALLAHYEARREAAGDEPTAEQADQLDAILDAVETINEALAGDPDTTDADEDSDSVAGEQDSDEDSDTEGEQDDEDDDGGEQDSADDPDTADTDEDDSDAVDLTETDARRDELVAASTATPPASAAPARPNRATRRAAKRSLSNVRSNAGTPATSTGPQFVAMQNTTHAQAGSTLDDAALANVMTAAAQAVGRQPIGTPVHVASVDLNDQMLVTPTSNRLAGAYQEAAREAIAKGRTRFAEEAAIQASGGTCAPRETDYTRTLIGGGMAGSFATAHPGVRTTRPTSFFEPDVIDVTNTSEGVGRVTDAEDTAGYGDPNADPSTVPAGGVPFKGTVKVPCPDPVDCDVAAIYQSVEVGRFMEMSFPEQVTVFRQETAVYMNLLRDKAFSDVYIDAGRILDGGAALFGSSRDTLSKVRQVIASVRSRRGDQSLPFEVWGPAWHQTPIASDLAKSFTGTVDLRPSVNQVLGYLAQDEGIGFGSYHHDIGTTKDGSPTVLPDLRGLADEAPLPAWPTQARLIIAPMGSVIRNSGDTVSFGVESLGMRTNDTLTFSELFESPCVLDPSGIFILDVPVAELGGTGAMVDASA